MKGGMKEGGGTEASGERGDEGRGRDRGKWRKGG